MALEAPWGTHAGAFTRFGPVEELVEDIDDRFVIMFHGDELTVEFAALPPPEAGLVRSFLLYADGFGKDMDPALGALADGRAAALSRHVPATRTQRASTIRKLAHT